MAGGSADAAAALVACDACGACDPARGAAAARRRARQRRAVRARRAAPRSAPAAASCAARWCAATTGGSWCLAGGAVHTAVYRSSTCLARRDPPPTRRSPTALMEALARRPATGLARPCTTTSAAALSPAARPGDGLEPGSSRGRARRAGLRLRPDLPVPVRQGREHALDVVGAFAAGGGRVVVASGPVAGAHVGDGLSRCANLVNLERVSKSYGVRPLLDRRLARRRGRRADRRRRPQRRRQDHPAAGARRAEEPPTPAGSPATAACGSATSPRATTSTRRATVARRCSGTRRPRVGRRPAYPRDRGGAARRGRPGPAVARALRR